jgi:cyclic dehypoxanthinyl futalosine synthase
VAEAGTVHFLTLRQIREAIEELGFVPRQRDVHYQLLDEVWERRALEANDRAHAVRRQSSLMQIA